MFTKSSASTANASTTEAASTTNTKAKKPGPWKRLTTAAGNAVKKGVSWVGATAAKGAVLAGGAYFGGKMALEAGAGVAKGGLGNLRDGSGIVAGAIGGLGIMKSAWAFASQGIGPGFDSLLKTGVYSIGAYGVTQIGGGALAGALADAHGEASGSVTMTRDELGADREIPTFSLEQGPDGADAEEPAAGDGDVLEFGG